MKHSYQIEATRPIRQFLERSTEEDHLGYSHMLGYSYCSMIEDFHYAWKDIEEITCAWKYYLIGKVLLIASQVGGQSSKQNKLRISSSVNQVNMIIIYSKSTNNKNFHHIFTTTGHRQQLPTTRQRSLYSYCNKRESVKARYRIESLSFMIGYFFQSWRLRLAMIFFLYNHQDYLRVRSAYRRQWHQQKSHIR